jgi:hypothetical protein
MKRLLAVCVGWLALLMLALIVMGGWAARASAPVEEAWAVGEPDQATIRGVVAYSGAISGTHIVWVGAFTTTLGVPPAFSTQFYGVGPYTLTVQPGTYYLYGGMDGDDSGGPPNPAIDPMGAYPGNPVSLSAGEVITGADITLVDPNQLPPGGGSISGLVSYAGRITTPHTVIVVAVREGEQEPAYHAIILAPGPYTLTQVADGEYMLLAFMDVGEDMGPPEPDEPFGWYDLDSNGPDPVVIDEGCGAGIPACLVSGIDILLRDPLRYVHLPLALKR